MADPWLVWYPIAERTTVSEWGLYVQPLMDKIAYDLSAVLELAPGHGRFTAELYNSGANLVHVVDIDPENVRFCRTRFEFRGERFTASITPGNSLPAVADEWASFVFSLFSMVHMERPVVSDYVAEFARIMRPGAFGLVNYSALETCPWPMEQSPHWRRQGGRAWFESLLARNGLATVETKTFALGNFPNLDATTVFQKPNA